MKTFHLSIVAVATILLGFLAGTANAIQPEAADDAEVQITDLTDDAQPDAVEAPSIDEAEVYDLAESYEEFVGDDLAYGTGGMIINPVPYSPRQAVRLGWWGVDVDGSRGNVGEWMGLDSSSPFYDIDGLHSNGYQTLDYFITGPENEANQGSLYFYGGPGFSMDIDYNRFIHRLGHDPLGGPAMADGYAPTGGFYDPPLDNGTPGYQMYGNDLSPGKDYALRVQQLQANFAGNITDNIKWRLNVWGMKKEGLRQANSQAHCYPDADDDSGNMNAGNTCHVVSQGQQVNWLTMEVEPVIEARFGWLTLEYSRTMRSFEQSDQIVTNGFTRGGNYGWGAAGADAAYGYVSENFTEIDRLKIGADLGHCTDLYVVGHLGNTHNRFRESDRRFYGLDGRITNNSFDGLSMTVYGKSFTQNNSPDTKSLNNRYPGQASLWLEQNQDTGVPVSPQQFYSDPPIEEPWYLGVADRDWLTFGTKARWRPFYDSCGLRSRLAITGGYEWKQLSRTNVTYDLVNLPNGGVNFTQPDTITNTLFAGIQQDWTYSLSSFVRYRMIENNWPLVGVTHRQQLSLDAAVNSNLPQHEDRVELGGTWNPTDSLVFNATLFIRNTYNHQDGVNFEEDSYPIVLSGWYQHDDRLSFSAGYANFSNWINQDVTLGREDGGFGYGGREYEAWTDTWSYKGQSDVVNLGVAYQVSCDWTVTGGLEYTSNVNTITNIPVNRYTFPPEIPEREISYSDIPGYTRVKVNTTRLTAGADYQISQNINWFGRYNFYDFDNKGWGYQSGTAHMFMSGLSAVY